MGPDNSVKSENIILDGAGSAGRFSRKHIETGANTALLYRAHQCVLIYYFGSGRVYEVGSGLHRGKERLVDQISSVVVERDVDADDIGNRRYFERRLLHLDSEGFSSFRCQGSAP